MENYNEGFDDRWHRGESQRPMPITGCIPKNIEEMNQHGSTFAQMWARWDESHLLTLEAAVQASVQIGREIKDKYDDMQIKMIKLATQFQASIDENRITRVRLEETLSEQRGMLKQACEENKELRKDWKNYISDSNSRWWQYALGSIGGSVALLGAALTLLRMFGKL